MFNLNTLFAIALTSIIGLSTAQATELEPIDMADLHYRKVLKPCKSILITMLTAFLLLTMNNNKKLHKWSKQTNTIVI